MKVVILGSGMMGRAIAYDLSKYSDFEVITIADRDRKTLQSAKKFLKQQDLHYKILNAKKLEELKDFFRKYDVAISAIPYKYNYKLAKIAVETKTHFLDLGGNDDIVKKERTLFEKAKINGVTIIADCGLAPGLTSVITRDIVEHMTSIEYVKIRVGGLPIDPQPPFDYQIVFSPHGLINEYVEDAIVLDHGRIVKKKSMTEIENVEFPEPFKNMEAFVTSGGVSTLPFTYRDKIDFLDYKTIRYPGHCERFKILLDLGFAEEKPVKIRNKSIIPRDFFADLLLKILPINKKDVVLLKVFSKGLYNGKKRFFEYLMIDYYDEKHDITSMMRTTAYPTSIIAQMIEKGIIKYHGVFGCEEIVACSPFFKELQKRGIYIQKEIR